MIAAIFKGYPLWATSSLALVATLVVSYLLAELIARGAWKLLRPLLGSHASGFQGVTLLRPIRLIRVVVFLLLAATLVLPAMELVGIRTPAHIGPEAIVAWLVESGVRIGLILLLSFVTLRIVALVLARFEQDVAQSGGPGHLEQIKRLRTLGNLVRSAVAVIIWSIATLMILRELRLDITPVLTTAGILGLAVGFGAQTLVKDVISGFFMILENQVRVGDVASINGTGGLVESITLRTIVLRDETGTVYVFPNGSVSTLANLTKDFSYYVLNIGVDYAEDTDRIVRLLTEVGAEVQAEPRFKAVILEPLEIIGVDDFRDASVVIKARIKTLPLNQWNVGRELRRRIKQRFDAEKVSWSRTSTIRVAGTDDLLAALAGERARREPAALGGPAGSGPAPSGAAGSPPPAPEPPLPGPTSPPSLGSSAPPAPSAPTAPEA